jgi:hypothetical protein
MYRPTAILRRIRVTTVVVEENMSYILCVSVALVIQHAKSMPHVVFSSVWPDRLYRIFSHYHINGTIV